MECEFCNKDFSDDLILEADYWKIILASEQSTIGRSLIILKRHAESLSELTKDEFSELQRLITKIETSIKRSFNADLFNWSCLMNNAFKSENPKPHVHWHCRPRYRSDVIFDNQVYKDINFSHHYDSNYTFLVSEETKKTIINEIKKNIE